MKLLCFIFTIKLMAQSNIFNKICVPLKEVGDISQFHQMRTKKQ